MLYRIATGIFCALFSLQQNLARAADESRLQPNLKFQVEKLNQATTWRGLRDLSQSAWSKERLREIDGELKAFGHLKLPIFKLSGNSIQFEMASQHFKIEPGDSSLNEILVNGKSYVHNADRPLATSIQLMSRLLNSKQSAGLKTRKYLLAIELLEVEVASAYLNYVIMGLVLVVGVVGSYKGCQALKYRDYHLDSGTINYFSTPPVCDWVVESVDSFPPHWMRLGAKSESGNGHPDSELRCDQMAAQRSITVAFCTKKNQEKCENPYQILVIKLESREKYSAFTVAPQTPLEQAGKGRVLREAKPPKSQVSIFLEECSKRGFELPPSDPALSPAAPPAAR